jgi:hypothetical protein
MDYDSDQYRDSMRDVLAMVEQCLELHADPDSALARENLAVLLDNADAGDCLRLSVSMLASTWQVYACVRASALGTPAEQELAGIFAMFRSLLA